jgi:hypothetical protein
MYIYNSLYLADVDVNFKLFIWFFLGSRIFDSNIFVVIGDNPHYLKHLSDYLPLGTLGSVASLLAAILYQGNPDRNHKLWTTYGCLSSRYNQLI